MEMLIANPMSINVEKFRMFMDVMSISPKMSHRNTDLQITCAYV